MKATIKFDYCDRRCQKTIKVDKNEPNYIIRELTKIDKRIESWTYIYTIKCDDTEYQWFGMAKDAIGENEND